tara:strand:+ start:798 stop:998 length:201 start_codon:yes stop_codon:yes gene_type:complete
MNVTKNVREDISRSLDTLEMMAFNQGYEAAVNALDEASNWLNNNGKSIWAEALRWAAKDLRGEHVE